MEKETIDHCISAIKERMKDKRINRFCNSSVKQGYTKALEILEKGITSYPDANIESLKTVQARAIAVLAVDFLNGECTEEVLAGVPIKDR